MNNNSHQRQCYLETSIYISTHHMCEISNSGNISATKGLPAMNCAIKIVIMEIKPNTVNSP